MDLSTNRFIVLSISLLLVVLSPQTSGSAPRPPQDVSCYACLVITDSGDVLWERRSKETVAIASATKIFTALVVRQEATLDQEVTVSAGAAATSGGKLSLLAGDRFSVEELLWGMLLNSSNDAAVALAEHVAGSQAGFAVLMNEIAAEMGAEDTSFVTAHGLDAPGHQSTATDLATAAVELLADPLLAEIVVTPRHRISGSRDIVLENTNVLLETYPGLLGVKTGFTSDAGNVLVAAAEHQGRQILTVALGSDDHFADTRAMLDFGFDALAREILLPSMSPLGSIAIGSAGATEVVAARTVRGLAAQHSVELIPRSDLVGPLSAGQRVGTILVRDGERFIGRSAAVAATDVAVEEQNWPEDLLTRVLGFAARLWPGEGP